MKKDGMEISGIGSVMLATDTTSCNDSETVQSQWCSGRSGRNVWYSCSVGRPRAMQCGASLQGVCGVGGLSGQYGSGW